MSVIDPDIINKVNLIWKTQYTNRVYNFWEYLVEKKLLGNNDFIDFLWDLTESFYNRDQYVGIERLCYYVGEISNINDDDFEDHILGRMINNFIGNNLDIINKQKLDEFCNYFYAAKKSLIKTGDLTLYRRSFISIELFIHIMYVSIQV